jgi:hypothetical protein
MDTKATPRTRYTIEDVRRLLSGPLEPVIDDAEAYWLEDGSGQRLTPESTRTLAPLARALDLANSGTDPDDLCLCARLVSGERYEIGGGVNLIGMAEGAAGIPRRPRTARRSRTNEDAAGR